MLDQSYQTTNFHEKEFVKCAAHGVDKWSCNNLIYMPAVKYEEQMVGRSLFLRIKSYSCAVAHTVNFD